MSSFESIITRKGQITLPAELRRRFRLNEGDRVAFVVNEDENATITIHPVRPVHERTYGVAARRDEPLDLDLARRMFAESRAQAYAELDRDPLSDDQSSN